MTMMNGVRGLVGVLVVGTILGTAACSAPAVEEPVAVSDAALEGAVTVRAVKYSDEGTDKRDFVLSQSGGVLQMLDTVTGDIAPLPSDGVVSKGDPTGGTVSLDGLTLHYKGYREGDQWVMAFFSEDGRQLSTISFDAKAEGAAGLTPRIEPVTTTIIVVAIAVTVMQVRAFASQYLCQVAADRENARLAATCKNGYSSVGCTGNWFLGYNLTQGGCNDTCSQTKSVGIGIRKTACQSTGQP